MTADPPFCLCMDDPCTCLTGDPTRPRASDLQGVRLAWVRRVTAGAPDPRALVLAIRRACTSWPKGCGDCEGCRQFTREEG